MRHFSTGMLVSLAIGLAVLGGATSNARAGALPAEVIQKVVREAQGKVHACYQERTKSVALSGTLHVQFTITDAGDTDKIQLVKEGSSLTDELLFKCIEKVLRGLKFPKPEGGAFEVTYPFIFAGGAEPKRKGKGPAKSVELRDEARAPAPAQTLAHPTRDVPDSSVGMAEVGSTRGTGAGTAPPPPTVRPLAKDKAPGIKKGESKPAPERDSAVATPETETPSKRPASPLNAPAMRAGRYDDNKQYNRFLEFIGAHKSMVVYPVEVDERLLIKVLDKDGKSQHNCTTDIKSVDGKLLLSGTTYADGSTQFFPADAAPKTMVDFVVEANCQGQKRTGQLPRAGKRATELRFDSARKIPARVPVDVAIVLDTTGSMQSQIDRLKKTLQAIHFQLTELPTHPDIRFGLVAYRDRGDDYVTRVTGFTADVDAFQHAINKLDADGGGDTPEDLQEALDKAMHQLAWRPEAVRVGFIVADAIPHTDYGQAYTYREAMREALKRGIKWVTVGAGGLPVNGEVIFRQMAQFTMGEYVFVTEGSGGDSAGGAGEASHHVGSNYLVENLDQAIIRIVRRELSYLTDDPKEVDDTIVATRDAKTPRDEVLAPAVAEALRQLVDYSSLKLLPQTPVAVLPVVAADPANNEAAGYLSDQFVLAASRMPAFKVVERDLKLLAQEQKLQLAELFDVKETVPFGKLVGAELLVVSKVTVRGAEADLFAKLIRVETGEVLSVARVRIGGGLS